MLAQLDTQTTAPRSVIHLHSENLKFPLRTAPAPSTHRQHHRETKFSHPSLCFTPLAFGGGSGSLAFHLETRNQHCCWRGWEGACGGIRTFPSGSFSSNGSGGCSTTHSVSWNSQIGDTWDMWRWQGSPQQRQDLTLSPSAQGHHPWQSWGSSDTG